VLLDQCCLHLAKWSIDAPKIQYDIKIHVVADYDMYHKCTLPFKSLGSGIFWFLKEVDTFDS